MSTPEPPATGGNCPSSAAPALIAGPAPAPVASAAAGDPASPAQPEQDAGRTTAQSAPNGGPRAHEAKAPVVGIVCSAGGLRALEELFAAVPPASGLAYLVMPHLAPDEPSMLVELLGRHAPIPVLAAVADAEPEPDHIYLARPGERLTLHGGRIHVEQLRATEPSSTALDGLLISLADDLGPTALGVVLSGTGESGVKGLRAIVDAGGLSVVQLPATAEYAAMPQAAIDAGLVDLALPPAQIPAALMEHAQPAGGDIAHAERSPQPAEQGALRRILTLLRIRTGCDFRDHRPSVVSRRIRRCMDQLGMGDIEAYLGLLRREPRKLEELCQDLMIGATGFFRDPEAFDALNQRVIEPLVEHHRGEAPMRLWVPGCGSGEEAYSVAMLVLEAFNKAGRAANVQVFATDIDRQALERARQGIYPESAMHGLSSERRERFFTSLGDGRQQVSKALRDVLVFAVQNLLRDVPFSHIDLITCRNVLIYLKPGAQEQAIARFHFALRPDGYLLLGNIEAVGNRSDMFKTISKRWRIFQRVGPSRGDLITMPRHDPRLAAPSPELPPMPGFGVATGSQDIARRALCELYAPAAVMINGAYEILYFHGPTADYLELPSGEPTRVLLEMLRKGLLSPVRDACQSSLRERRPARVSNANVLRGSSRVPVEILVHPVRESRRGEQLLLVTFRDRGPAAKAEAAQAIEASQGPVLTAAEQLELELRATRDDLRSTIEELQSANERLIAANEEVVSINEELQSTNEELQTSKEELQSLNEELATVNSQMHEKVGELERRNADVGNLLAATNAATVFLDRELRIKLFTPACRELLNLRPTDHGRPLAELRVHVDDPHLLADCGAVLESLSPVERQVGGDAGRRYLRRILPYRSQDDRIEGVVLTLTDITAASAAEARLRASERHYRRRFEDAPIRMVEQDWSAAAEVLRGVGQAAADPAFFTTQPETLAACREGIRMTAVNRAARALLGMPDDEAVPLALPRACCAGQLGTVLAAFAAGQRVAQCEDELRTASGQLLPVLCQFALVPGSEESLERVLVMILDLSAQKALERRLADSEQRLRRALRLVHEAVWEYDIAQERLWWSDEYDRQFGKPTPLRKPLAEWWAERIHPHDRVAAQARLQQAIDEAAEGWQAEYRYRRADGQYVPVLERGALDRDATGRLTRVLGCMLDMSDLKSAQRALSERETRLRSVLEAAAEAIITADTDGRILTFNPAAEAMFRCTAEAVTGTPLRGLFARANGAPPDPLAAQDTQQRRTLQARRASGDTFPLELSARFVEEQGLWVVVGRDLSDQRRLERDVIELSTRQQEELGREIHDGLGQELTALLMLSHSIRRQLEDRRIPATPEAFAQIEEYLRHALDTCRTIARGLSAEVSAPGLENALSELATGMERASGIPCRFAHTGRNVALSEQQAAHLYRIAQEAVSNAMRHAQARRVDIDLEVDDTVVVLRVRDDGQGIPPGAKRGLGLRLMAYRAGMLGGTCTVQDAASGGTVVECRVPHQH